MPTAPAAPSKEHPSSDESKGDETPRDRFTRLGVTRVENAVDALRKIGLLGNKSAYEYTDEDITKIDAAVTEAKDAAIKALKVGKVKPSTGFSL